MEDRLEKGAQLRDGQYTIVGHLRSGGQTNVYLAFNNRLEIDVVIKETLGKHEWMRDAVEREAKMLARLSNKGLPQVYDYFTENATGYLVMKFIEGDDFDTMLGKRSEPFSVEEVVRWGAQLLDIIEYLHSRPDGIIHRDINPRNIKLNSAGEILLLDFGIAKYISSVTPLLGGSPHYASPEQLKDEGTGAVSDLYSLAATLYHLMTLIQPPDALTRQTLVLKQQPDPLRPPHECNGGIPIDISKALMGALSLDPSDRPQSVGMMRRALREAMAISLGSEVNARMQPHTPLTDESRRGSAPGEKRITISLEATSGRSDLEEPALRRAAAQPKAKWTFAAKRGDRVLTELRAGILRARNYELNILVAMGITGAVGFIVGWFFLHDSVGRSVDRMLPPAFLTKATVLYFAAIYAMLAGFLIIAFYRVGKHSVVSLATFLGFLVGCIGSFLLMTLPIITK